MGEVEYDEILTPNKLEGTLNDNNITIDEINEGAYFPIASQIIAAAFILSLSIIIMNLLFGLAVADIQVH